MSSKPPEPQHRLNYQPDIRRDPPVSKGTYRDGVLAGFILSILLWSLAGAFASLLGVKAVYIVLGLEVTLACLCFAGRGWRRFGIGFAASALLIISPLIVSFLTTCAGMRLL